MRLPDDIAAKISSAIVFLAGENTLPARMGREHGAIPLLADLGGATLLRPDGTFLEVAWDQETERNPLQTAAPRSTADLVAGAERYPWLKALLPTRPTGAMPCRDCGGAGRIFVGVTGIGGGHVYCGTCGALGWIAV
jgi:hypothetical protein